MDSQFLIVTLALGTLLAVLAIAVLSKRRTEQRRKDPDAAKSRLAEDAPDVFSNDERS